MENLQRTVWKIMYPNAGLQMVKMEITEKVLLKKLSL